MADKDNAPQFHLPTMHKQLNSAAGEIQAELQLLCGQIGSIEQALGARFDKIEAEVNTLRGQLLSREAKQSFLDTALRIIVAVGIGIVLFVLGLELSVQTNLSHGAGQTLVASGLCLIAGSLIYIMCRIPSVKNELAPQK